MQRLTVPQGAALLIVAVLGTGVIALPALSAEIAGPASILAWVAMLVLAIPLAATFAALGARHPDAGGVSTYVRRAFGARAATVVGWCFYFAVPAGAPAAGLFGGAYVADLIGGGLRTAALTALVLLAAATACNAAGLRVSGRVQLTLAIGLAGLLLTATLTALPYASWDNLRPFAPHGWLALGPAIAMIVWAFAGWEAVTSLAGDYRRPERDVGRVTALALVAVGVLYLGVVSASILVLGPSAGTSEAPLADLLAVGVGEPARILTVIAALLLTFGAMNAYLAGAGKLGAALGRDGALPGWFATGSEVGEVPRRSLFVVAGLSFGTLGLTTIAGLGVQLSVLLTTGAIVTVYVLGTAAAVRLLPPRSRGRRIAVVAFVIAVFLLVMVGLYVLYTVALTMAALLYHRHHRTRSRQHPPPVSTLP